MFETPNKTLGCYVGCSHVVMVTEVTATPHRHNTGQQENEVATTDSAAETRCVAAFLLQLRVHDTSLCLARE
ncbi:hypothetical protein VNO77_23749 [Canavalia gladiata]|uniref:Uncharacterized protein n=1 Tax=Canavalia gladiata TaxID=3824 RepID=A0AAN9L5G9_CANGL